MRSKQSKRNMEKRNRVMLGVNKKKAINKRSKKRLVNKVAGYLKSDCYMYAPLVSSLPFAFGEQKGSLFAQGLGVEELGDEKDKTLMKKVMDYIKSDCYMYSSVADCQFTCLPTTPADPSKNTVNFIDSTEKSTIQQPDGIQPERKTIEERPVGKDSPVRQRVERRDMAKRVVYQNCRPSTRSGKTMLNYHIRNVTVE